MSDNLMSFVPHDRHFVPDVSARERAVDMLRAFAPSADEICDNVSEEVEFIDCGGNWSGVRCSSCGANAEPWFGEELNRCYKQSHFRNLDAVAACCGAAVSLDTLNFGWPVGFSRFVLEARNPRLSNSELLREVHRTLEQTVACSLRVIWRRY